MGPIHHYKFLLTDVGTLDVAPHDILLTFEGSMEWLLSEAEMITALEGELDVDKRAPWGVIFCHSSYRIRKARYSGHDRPDGTLSKYGCGMLMEYHNSAFPSGAERKRLSSRALDRISRNPDLREARDVAVWLLKQGLMEVDYAAAALFLDVLLSLPITDGDLVRIAVKNVISPLLVMKTVLERRAEGD